MFLQFTIPINKNSDILEHLNHAPTHTITWIKISLKPHKFMDGIGMIKPVNLVPILIANVLPTEDAINVSKDMN